jgi:hypothetical protein
MRLPIDRDERTESFHEEAQKLVWGWAKTSKLKAPIADTMDPLSCLTYAIVQQMEKVYQASKAAEEPPKSKLSSLFGR